MAAPKLTQETRDRTDYLTSHMRDNPEAQIEIFSQMLYVLELYGECRDVYHRLSIVLFGQNLR